MCTDQVFKDLKKRKSHGRFLRDTNLVYRDGYPLPQLFLVIQNLPMLPSCCVRVIVAGMISMSESYLITNDLMSFSGLPVIVIVSCEAELSYTNAVFVFNPTFAAALETDNSFPFPSTPL